MCPGGDAGRGARGCVSGGSRTDPRGRRLPGAAVLVSPPTEDVKGGESSGGSGNICG